MFVYVSIVLLVCLAITLISSIKYATWCETWADFIWDIRVLYHKEFGQLPDDKRLKEWALNQLINSNRRGQ